MTHRSRLTGATRRFHDNQRAAARTYATIAVKRGQRVPTQVMSLAELDEKGLEELRRADLARMTGEAASDGTYFDRPSNTNTR